MLKCKKCGRGKNLSGRCDFCPAYGKPPNGLPGYRAYPIVADPKPTIGEQLETLAKSAYPGSMIYKDTDSVVKEPLISPIGLCSINVPAASTMIIRAQSQVNMEGGRLVIDPNCADYFLVEDFLIGTHSMFFNGDPVPAIAFLPVRQIPTNHYWERKISVALTISIRVQNITGTGHPFYAYFVCKEV